MSPYLLKTWGSEAEAALLAGLFRNMTHTCLEWSRASPGAAEPPLCSSSCRPSEEREVRGSSNFNSSGFSRYRGNYLGDAGAPVAPSLAPPAPLRFCQRRAAALPYPVFFCSSALLGGRRTQNRNRISFLRRRPKNKKKTNQTFKTQERSTPTPPTPSCAKRLTSSEPPPPLSVPPRPPPST